MLRISDPGLAQRKIAILGWGSLLWDPGTLAPGVSGRWAMCAGPRLPMEFCRVSPKRKLALTVCLDTVSGEPCATHVILSRRTLVSETRAELATREHAPLSRIGWAGPDGTGESRMPELVERTSAWCAQNGWSGVVWTELEPNFSDVTGSRFSVGNGTDYLRGLRDQSLREAYRYIRNAPGTTRTPLRRALACDPWWRSLRHQQL